MERVIKLDVYNKDFFFEKYNENMVSSDLINYLIEHTIFISKNDTVKIIINNKLDLGYNCIEMIKDGLRCEYQKNLKNVGLLT